MRSKDPVRVLKHGERHIGDLVKKQTAKFPKLAAPKLHKRDPSRHLKSCECVRCLKRKIAKYKARIDEMFVPRPPESADQMIPVRAHFRRHPRYMESQPVLWHIIHDFAATAAKAFVHEMVVPSR